MGIRTSSEKEREKDRLYAQNIAHTKSIEIMKEMDICDEHYPNYALYRYNLEFNLYHAIKKSLKL